MKRKLRRMRKPIIRLITFIAVLTFMLSVTGLDSCVWLVIPMMISLVWLFLMYLVNEVHIV